MTATTTAALLALLSASPSGERPRLLVLDFTAGGGATAEEAQALTEAAVSAASARDIFQVVSARDVETLLGLERQRQLVGCAEDEASCLAELAGALGARFVLSGTLSRVGGSYQLTLQTLDSSRAQALGRSVRLAPSLAPLRAALPWAVAEATGIPAPPPPSRLLPYSLMGAGGVMALGAGAFGMIAYAEQSALQRELDIGARQTGVLGPVATYEEAAGRLSLLKTTALVLVLAGAATATAGFLLNPPSVADGGFAMMTLLPLDGGGAVVLGGTF